MKNSLLSCLCSVICLITPTLAQEPAVDDKDALRALASRYENAISEGNLMLLKDSVREDASAVFITGEKISGLAAMQAYLEKIKSTLGEGSSYSVKLIPDDTYFDGDIAIAEGISEEKVKLAGGKEFSYQTRWTATLKKTDGKWQALRLHVSLNPFDNPIISYRARMQKWTYGGIAGTVGLMLGIFIRKFRRKASMA
jgi:uncharacterized protein (TIGR02246 family)